MMSSTTPSGRVADTLPAEGLRRGALSRPPVLAAALALVDGHGLAQLSMRKLGRSLGVEAMALYNHVRSKDDVLDGIVELLWDQIEDAIEPSADWTDMVRSMATAIRAVVHEHPAAAPLLVSRNLLPLPALRVFAAQLDRLRCGGRSPEQGAEAIRTVVSYALGYAITETGCLGGPSTDSGVCQARVGVADADAPAGALPDGLADVAATMAACDLDVQFRSGLELIVDGMRVGHRR